MKKLTTLLLLSPMFVFGQFSTSDLIQFNAYFGEPIPDLQPDFFGYYQDIVAGFDSFNNESNVHGDESMDILNQFTYVWQLKPCADCLPYAEFEGFEIPFNEMFLAKGICEGGFWVTLLAIHSDGATFENTKPCWAFWGGVDYPDCDFGVQSIDHFNYPLQPPYSPYQYQTGFSYWDANQNNVRDTADLLKILQGFGN